MDPLNTGIVVTEKSLEEYGQDKNSQIVALKTKTPTKSDGNIFDKTLGEKTCGNNVTSKEPVITDLNHKNSFEEEEINIETMIQGQTACVETTTHLSSVTDKDFIEELSLVPPKSAINKEDDLHRKICVSQSSTVNERDDLKVSSDETQKSSDFEKKIKDGIDEEFMKRSSKNEHGKNNPEEEIELENLTPIEMCSESIHSNSTECYRNADELQKEFKRIIEDIHNLEVYTKSVLDVSKSRLEYILGRLQQDNPLQLDVIHLLTKIDKHLKESNEIISEQRKPICLAKMEDTFQDVKPNNNEKEKEIPLRDSNDMDLLLIGSSGNGKSSTGNYILGNNVFQTAAGTSSKTSTSAKSSSKFKELTVNVVDSCGIDTNGKTKLDVLEETLKSIKESLELCNHSFNALLLIIKFGSRFTQHESYTVRMIRGVLGNDVIKKYGVCVVTHGDNFEYEMEEEEAEEGKAMTFEEWCRAQVGEIGEIFKECNFRCVLFNNKDKSKREEQLENLLSLIKHNEKYSRDQFLKADEGLSKLTQELLLPEVIENTHKLVNDIRNKLSMKVRPDSYECFEMGNEMLKELDQYKNYIFDSRWDEFAQRTLLSVIEPLELELKSKLKLCQVETLGKRQKDLLKQHLIGAHYLEENHFGKSRNEVIATTDDAGTITKSYTPEEITKLEKVVKTNFDKLKNIWKTSSSATSDVVNTINQKIKCFKEDYSDFLSSPAGREMLDEIIKFQNEIMKLHIDRQKLHQHESNKWDEMKKEMSIWNYLLSFLYNSKNA